MISRFEERFYNDINSLASTMPRVVELLEKLVDSKVPSTSTKTQPTVKIASTTPIKKTKQEIQSLRQKYEDNDEWAEEKKEIKRLRQENGYEKCDCGKELGMPDYWVCDICDIGKRNRAIRERLGCWNKDLMHSRPINWNPDDELYFCDLTVVFKNDKGELVVTPICTRCNYRYSAYSRNGNDWNCENCGYEWQTHNNFLPFQIFNTECELGGCNDDGQRRDDAK